MSRPWGLMLWASQTNPAQPRKVSCLGGPRLRVAHEDTPILTSIPELGLVLLLPAVEADAIAWA